MGQEDEGYMFQDVLVGREKFFYDARIRGEFKYVHNETALYLLQIRICNINFSMTQVLYGL